MFTGIITGTGEIRSVEGDSRERKLVVATPYADVVLGESVAINGVCLTATGIAPEAGGARLTFYVSGESCERSNLGALEPGTLVNLERAMRLGDRVSGHLVQGHVDGTAVLASVKEAGASRELKLDLPRAMLRHVIEKGSIALDGISLTVNSIEDSSISLMIIPHTWQETNLHTRRPGARINVELDMISKYVERQWNPAIESRRPS